MPALKVFFFIALLAICVSCQSIYENKNYQDVMTNARHAYEKYLKRGNEHEENIHEKIPSSLLMDSTGKDVRARAAQLLSNDKVGAPVDWRFDVSDKCLNHTEMILEALVSGEMWALQMIDAMGKPSSNLLSMHTKWLGSYDECMKLKPMVNISGTKGTPFLGKYCGTSFKTTKFIAIFPPGIEIDEGFCVPDTCTTRDTFSLVYVMAFVLGIDTTNMKPPTVWCQERHLEMSAKAIAAIAICAKCIIRVIRMGLDGVLTVLYISVVGLIFVSVMVIATAYDVIVIRWIKHKQAKFQGYSKLHDDTKHLKQNGAGHSYGTTDMKTPLETSFGLDKSSVVSHSRNDVGRKGTDLNTAERPYQPGTLENLLLSFSVYTNASKLLNTNQSAGTLTAVNGIRFVSMTWVVLGHSYAFGLQTGENVEDFLPNNLKRFTFQAVSNATVSVDTFFALSGLLVSFLSLKEMKKRDGPRYFKWGMFYFHRFWRLTPPYMLFMLMYVPLFKHWSDGPMWPQGGLENKECEETWWTNLLYINNIVKSKTQCMGWSWYLANDMQFYILSPLMLIPLYYSSFLGGLSCLVFVLISMISTGVISSSNDIGVATLLQAASFDKIYYKPWCRVGPYAIGFFAGYILYKTDCKLRIPKLLNIVIWLVAAGLAILVLYGLWDPDNMYPDLSKEVSALYNATFRNVWAAAVVWVVIACATDNGGWINTLLSWKGVIPLSRLTYCAYLIHPPIIYTYFYSRRNLVYFNNIEMVYLFCGNIILSFCGAFILSMAFEAPMMGLEKVLLGKGKKT